MALRIGINGLGRIGRLALRHALERRQSPGVRQGPAIEVVAANDLAAPGDIAYLIRHDSVHRGGPECTVDGDTLRVGDFAVKVTSERDPAKIPWAELGVDVVLECTGRFTNRETMALHRTNPKGPGHVILGAPGKGVDKTVVVGVNDDQLDLDKDRLISNASCTTNGIAPVLAVLDRAFGFRWGIVGTTHAYTHGQGLVDVLDPKDRRRGRAAAINIVPTSTGAARAVGLVLPNLQGKIDGTAVRVPVPNGSLYDITMNLEGAPELSRVIETLRDAAQGEQLRGILDVRDADLVSSDIIGDPHSSIVDVGACIAMGPLVKVVGWYDNEWGYAGRLIDLAAVVGRAYASAN
ncbi:MAG: aldehyde dehydrogenase [Myxococcales bacterium]|nr:aldehyde dehydrogenase [Myxococcales bacterium]MCB9700525.1 aldehyde dehydrogenase [Myxococcales bacterium]